MPAVNDVIVYALRFSQGMLQRPLSKPHPRFRTVGELAHFMALQGIMHGGQITIIRRSLGRPPVV